MLRGPRIGAPKVVDTKIDLVYANRSRLKSVQSLHKSQRLMDVSNKGSLVIASCL